MQAFETANMEWTKIGTQIWSAKNLDVDTFRNGDSIPQVTANEEWEKVCLAKQPAWCYYNNDPANDSAYGKLYNWYAVNDPRGLAPSGWHVASNEEWKLLTEFLGGSLVAGKKLKSKQGWERDGNGSNETNFSALPAGERHGDGEFSSLGSLTAWYTSSEHLREYAWEYYMYYFDDHLRTSHIRKNGGFSVRCVRD